MAAISSCSQTMKGLNPFDLLETGLQQEIYVDDIVYILSEMYEFEEIFFSMEQLRENPVARPFQEPNRS